MNIKGLIVVLFAPSAGGKDTVIQALHQQGLVCPCVRETTRAPRLGDNGHYRFVSSEEFQSRRQASQYVFDHEYCGQGYAVPLEDLRCLLNSDQIPILKGSLNCIRRDRQLLLQYWPGVKVMTIELVPEPIEKWLNLIQQERYDNVADRISEGQAELELAQGELRDQIDHLVINHFGDLEKTIKSVKALIQV